MGALWALWILSLVFLIGLWWLTLSGNVSSVLKARQIAALEATPQLEESFRALQQLGEVMLATSAQDARQGISPKRLVELREQGEPYYEFFYFKADGRNVLAEDEAEVPGWIQRELRELGREGETIALRPLPPGYQSRLSDTDTPDNYLAFGRRLPGGESVVWLLDWDHVFGPWLDRQVGRFGLGDSVRGTLHPWGTAPPTDPGPDQALPEMSPASLVGSEFIWSWEVPALLPDQPHTLDSLRLTVRNREAVVGEVYRNLPYLLAGIVLLGGLAIVLALTARALRREQEFTKARAQFISQVSHELRTPITALEMYLEILADGLVESPEKIEEYHQILRRESHRLKSLVENLLTVGQVESGRWSPRKEKLDLKVLMERVVEMENRGGRDVTTTALEESVELEADREALQAVLANLLQNALKYSPANKSVEMTISATKEVVRIMVSDRGTGLSVDDYREVFRPYFRAGRSAEGKPGVGLGLSLVRQIVEAHEGKVWGEPRQGGGSVFTVQLPRR